MYLKDKVAIITGAAHGIGRSIAIQFAKEGTKLALVDLKRNEIEGVLNETKNLKAQSIAIEADITSYDATRQMVKETIDTFGQVDILINNAGIIIMSSFFEKPTYENWDRIFNVNLKGQLLCCQAVMPTMMDRKLGRIVNISSIGSKKPQTEFLSYCLSKIAVNGLTEVLAKGLGEYNITVNAICPGFIETNMWKNHISPSFSPLMEVKPDEVIDTIASRQTLLKRSQTGTDIAEAVSFLCKADNITGITLNISGGYEIMEPN